jgi:hypothetical protein
MSLWLIRTTTGIIEYALCDGQGGIYAPDLCAGNKIYKEEIDEIGHFFYEPSHDLLVSYIKTRQKAWPGWAAYRYEWNPETGAFIKRTWCGILPISYPNHAGLGSFGKVFTTSNLAHIISEVPWDTLAWASPRWTIDPTTWTPARLFQYALVNLQDGLIVGVVDRNLETWDISGTPTMQGTLRLPNLLGYLCMESREICWVITRDGLILKANYKDTPPRWEMLSSVQDPSPDTLNYFMAWDQKRGRLVVLRQRPDAEDGTCQCQFEFYKPLVKIINITDPVPVSRHRAGDVVEFVAHLYGATGEGVTPYRVRGRLQAPAAGTLLRSEATSGLNGAISLVFQAPADVEEDTIILETTINDGAL